MEGGCRKGIAPEEVCHIEHYFSHIVGLVLVPACTGLVALCIQAIYAFNEPWNLAIFLQLVNET